MRKSNEVNKVFVGMTKNEAKQLLTEKCKKCGHLVDDHLKTMEAKDTDPYVCRDCGCKTS